MGPFGLEGGIAVQLGRLAMNWLERKALRRGGPLRFRCVYTVIYLVNSNINISFTFAQFLDVFVLQHDLERLTIADTGFCLAFSHFHYLSMVEGEHLHKAGELHWIAISTNLQERNIAKLAVCTSNVAHYLPVRQG